MRSTFFRPAKGKTNQEIILSEFRNLNKQLKRKPYPMPEIWGMLWKFKGF